MNQRNRPAHLLTVTPKACRPMWQPLQYSPLLFALVGCGGRVDIASEIIAAVVDETPGAVAVTAAAVTAETVTPPLPTNAPTVGCLFGWSITADTDVCLAELTCDSNSLAVTISPTTLADGSAGSLLECAKDGITTRSVSSPGLLPCPSNEAELDAYCEIPATNPPAPSVPPAEIVVDPSCSYSVNITSEGCTGTWLCADGTTATLQVEPAGPDSGVANVLTCTRPGAPATSQGTTNSIECPLTAAAAFPYCPPH